MKQLAKAEESASRTSKKATSFGKHATKPLLHDKMNLHSSVKVRVGIFVECVLLLASAWAITKSNHGSHGPSRETLESGKLLFVGCGVVALFGVGL